MKHLKKIFESNIQETMNTCKDILTDLKDDYPNITFQICDNESEKFCIIKVEPNYDESYSRHEIEFIEKKLNFIKDFLNCCKTIKQSINKYIRIADIFYDEKCIAIYFEK